MNILAKMTAWAFVGFLAYAFITGNEDIKEQAVIEDWQLCHAVLLSGSILAKCEIENGCMLNPESHLTLIRAELYLVEECPLFIEEVFGDYESTEREAKNERSEERSFST